MGDGEELPGYQADDPLMDLLPLPPAGHRLVAGGALALRRIVPGPAQAPRASLLRRGLHREHAFRRGHEVGLPGERADQAGREALTFQGPFSACGHHARVMDPIRALPAAPVAARSMREMVESAPRDSVLMESSGLVRGARG